MKPLRRAACCCMIVPAFALGAGLFWFGHLLRPVSSSRRVVTINIKPNSDARQIAQQLQSRHLIRSELVFLWVAGRRGALTKLKPGRYRLSPSMTAGEIVEKMKKGPDEEKVAVIPEGFTVKQIAERLEANGVIKNAEEFEKIAGTHHASLSAPFKLPSGGLEGYLYPDTYRFAPNTKPEKAAQTMLDAFTKQIYDKHRAEIDRSPHSLNEIVTIASLIEREAEVERDRAKIAGVIENRLKKKMLLQIDASLDYAHGRHLTHPTYKDLEINSPYNTYRRKGLPPGPIASPGEASIVAALNPETNDYLYYIAGPDKSHIFTKTEAEHNAVKARLRAQSARRDIAGLRR